MKPKILFLDIETAPIMASIWQLWEQNVSLDMVEKDWYVLAFSCKWADSKKIIYMDQRNSKNIENDRKLLKVLWKLMDQADFIVGQNSNKFDIKKLNARFILNGFPPPSNYSKIDTKVIASKHFAFTSNKLAYLSENLNIKYKKLDHKKFPGIELWKECIKGNLKAWKEMERYNKHDVLALEELYHKLAPWESSIDFNAFYNDDLFRCSCGSTHLNKHSIKTTRIGRFQRYQCQECGKTHQSKINLLSKEKRMSMRKIK